MLITFIIPVCAVWLQHGTDMILYDAVTSFSPVFSTCTKINLAICPNCFLKVKLFYSCPSFQRFPGMTETTFPQSQKYTSYLVPQFKTVLYLCVHGYTSEYTRMVLGWVPPEPWNQDWVKIVGLELYPRKYQWRRAVIGCVNSSSTCKRADLTPTIKKKKATGQRQTECGI